MVKKDVLYFLGYLSVHRGRTILMGYTGLGASSAFSLIGCMLT
jgi:hypothetical protein